MQTLTPAKHKHTSKLSHVLLTMLEIDLFLKRQRIFVYKNTLQVLFVETSSYGCEFLPYGRNSLCDYYHNFIILFLIL